MARSRGLQKLLGNQEKIVTFARISLYNDLSGLLHCNFLLTDRRSSAQNEHGKPLSQYFYIMNTDPIADYLTRVRNAIKANHRVVEIPASNLKKEITKVLFDKGYIANYKFVEEGPQGSIKIALKYNPISKVPAIRTLTRVSKPGLRKYANVDNMPRVLNGLGIAILSTSKGVMTDKEARLQNVGGEVL